MSLIPNGLAKSAAEAGFYTHPINQSLRLNDDDSAYLSWTPASAGNRKTWTWSGWVKRSNLGTNQKIFHAFSNTSDEFNVMLNSSDALQVEFYESGVGNYYIRTNAVYRDASAWYHIVVSVDTTQATSSNRYSLYVNGEKVTSFAAASYPTQNLDMQVNESGTQHRLGARGNNSDYFDGYMAEVHFIDGTALDASSFGEFKSGVWIPKAYAGSYGTNGFYLDFDGTYYNDKSGNGNNFTANNLAATDVVLDSPTNNFATLNPLDPHGGNAGTLAEGNLKHISESSGSWTRSTFWITSGKWYTEFLRGSGYLSIQMNYGDTYAYYTSGGSIHFNGSSVGTYSTFATGDIIGVAIDRDANTLKFYKNNSLVYTGTSLASGDLKIGLYLVSPAGDYSIANFGQDSSFAGNKTAQGNTDDNGYGDFYYAPPTGYLALCTANLEVPDAMNPALDNSPQDYFNTVLYTGNGSTQSITGVGFQPDWIFFKERSSTSAPQVFDVIRGATYGLTTSSTGAEWTYSNTMTSFDADGFSLGDSAGTNESSQTYVAWNWKANGSGVSNTDGSITSTVSANTDAGFSIVSFTGAGANATVGHGLNSAPTFMIFKSRDDALSWIVFPVGALGNNYRLYLNDTDAAYTSSSSVFLQDTDPTDSVVYLGSATNCNASGDAMIAYCFHDVEGFSKFGSYTGNGSTDGTFCYTGFRPAFVMMKRTDVAGNWFVQDSARNTYNVASNTLYPNLSDAEGSGTYLVDYVSNGFKHRFTGNPNASGGTYIFMAFAENPLKFSTAV